MTLRATALTLVTLPIFATLLTLRPVAPAHALCPDPGGVNQTSEPQASTRNTLSEAATPGTARAGLNSDNLLISEVKGNENRREFIEIYNPTASTIHLDDYYVTDYESEDGIGTRRGYWEVVSGGAFTIDNATDFVARFPAGSVIFPGQAIVIATGASTAQPPGPFLGGTADFEILDVSGVANMQLLGGTPSGAVTGGLLFDNAEFVMLFKWDGACDLVCDVDYLSWGPLASGNSRADKTGIEIDGPDEDMTPSAFLPDIAANQQERTTAATGDSIIRTSVGLQQAGGNGCLANAVPVRALTWGSLKSMFR